MNPAASFNIISVVGKTGAQLQREYRKRLRDNPVAWKSYLQRGRIRDRERRPRTTPRPEDFDWSVIWKTPRRSDTVKRLVFGEIWNTILFTVPSLWNFRIHCARLNRKHALKMKARWINQHNPEHVEKLSKYNNRPDITERRRQSHARRWRDTSHIRKTPEYRAMVAQYERLHTQASPQRRISKRLRHRIYEQIKLSSGRKNQKTEQLLGCTIPELMRHLESKFQTGMSWDNYGLRGWHIDHKTPCAAFDLTDEEQQRICFHHTNLQPLWSTENWSKSSKLPNGLKAHRKTATV